ncbi:hypothetical protein N7467_004410 [Penicillium canescens]|nr:hypothetical protein N7467_004410 [Penicillium canescens]
MLALLLPSGRNNDILTSIVIIRLFKKMDDQDYQCHLSRITKMLASDSLLKTLSSLHEAATWLYLRQDIYISPVTQKSPRPDQVEFPASTM